MILNNTASFKNPVLDSAVKMYRQNNVAGLEQMARNMAKEKGVDIDELRHNIGL